MDVLYVFFFSMGFDGVCWWIFWQPQWTAGSKIRGRDDAWESPQGCSPSTSITVENPRSNVVAIGFSWVFLGFFHGFSWVLHNFPFWKCSTTSGPPRWETFRMTWIMVEKLVANWSQLRTAGRRFRLSWVGWIPSFKRPAVEITLSEPQITAFFTFWATDLPSCKARSTLWEAHHGFLDDFPNGFHHGFSTSL